ncbi:MAG TPA: hypothetical protein VNZ49_11815, partial [Bacteroidia bacterium]|nr:hypothetical protein [Bacteroidia bacterium]
MKATMYKSILMMFSLGICVGTQARENANVPDELGQGHRDGHDGQVLTGCIAGKTQTELKINDVRTRILTDGDMWWDLTNAKYEIPKGSNSMAQFAGSLWFGGYHNGSLRISAMTYRQNGVDFWPGPLNPSNVNVDPTVCTQYDRHYIFNRTDVDNFYSYWKQYGAASPNTASWIKDYPGNYDYGIWSTISDNSTLINVAGAPLTINYLAPYFDNNGDGYYNFADGDYPNYNVSGAHVKRGECVRKLFGDQTIFWVFNDKGSKHGETGGVSIGVEIRAQAFEFSTGDELNSMTFYNYEVINWSSDKLDSTYFTVWDDCDLGNYLDDYIGCDVKRGLGYQYNGDNYDEDANGLTGYHDKLPAIGCDFFQGPYADLGDGIDNDRDSCIDCSWYINPATGKPDYTVKIPDTQLPEQIIMSRFTYYTNTGDAQTGNPTSNSPQQYYNFMDGKWRNGTWMTYGQSGLTQTNQHCSFLFPGITDPNGWGLGYHPGGPVQTPNNGPYGTKGWTQKQAGVVKNDMRFLQSCGKFTLKPGAVNYVTYGIPFARSNSADNEAPIPLLQTADDKAQALFDNCFKVLDGPDAPDLTIQEISNQLLFTISNNPYVSNNYEAKRYQEADPTIQPVGTVTNPDQLYRFQGYIVYQLKDETVSPSDLYNADKARIVFQCDIKDGVKQLINYTGDPVLGTVPQLMVSGNDAGIQNSFVSSQDKFASGDQRMVNFKNYYYMAISYAYNNYLTYVPNVAPTAAYDTAGGGHIVFTDPSSGDYNGQKKPFLGGRKNIKVYTGIPHDPTPEAYGSVMNSSYGIGPMITRIEGQGNGGFALDLTDQSISDILNPANNNRVQKITYVGNRGPIGVKVTDPLRVVKGDFTVKFIAATKVKVGPDSLWQYFGNPPAPATSTLDTGKVKASGAMRWYMTGTYTDANGNNVTKTWLSDEAISVGQEKIITGNSNEPLGFSVTIKQVADPQMTAKVLSLTSKVQAGATLPTDLLESSINYSDAGNPWLGQGGLQNVEGSTTQNWILSGGSAGDISGKYGSGLAKSFFADASGTWARVVNGTWAPFRFVKMGPNDWTPGYSNFAFSAQTNPDNYCDTRLLSSVDIVFTSDQSKWTHCPVIDMSGATNPHSGLPRKWQLRHHLSVDKNGNSVAPGTDPVSDSSMSWFPGYAINLETGERLNIIFGENSADSIINHGNDMMWNPTKTILDNSGNVVNGGMHYIYVLGHNGDGNDTLGGEIIPCDVRRYDAGLSAFKMLKGLNSWPYDFNAMGGLKASKFSLLAELFKDIMWVNIPIPKTSLNKPTDIPGDVKIKIRVTKPYRYGLSSLTSPANTSKTGASSSVLNLTYTNTPINSDAIANIPSDVVNLPANGNFPMYTFNTNDLAPKTYNSNVAKDALAKINVVPNPYYGHSAYEKTRIDNVIKIINLPVKCKIRIYTLAGTLVRTLEKDNDQTYITWDLKNDKNVTVASGLYIMHIDAPGIGERIIKW